MKNEDLESNITVYSVGDVDVEYDKKEDAYYFEAYFHDTDVNKISKILYQMLNDEDETINSSVYINNFAMVELLGFMIDDDNAFLDNVFEWLSEDTLNNLKIILDRHIVS